MQNLFWARQRIFDINYKKSNTYFQLKDAFSTEKPVFFAGKTQSYHRKILFS